MDVSVLNTTAKEDHLNLAVNLPRFEEFGDGSSAWSRGDT